MQLRTLLTACVVIAGTASHARAQAWVGEENTFGASATYQFSTANRTDDVPSDVMFHIISLGAEYVLPKQIALSAKLPHVWVKVGEDGTPHGPFDDGSYHRTFTDLRFGARRPFGVLDDRLMLTPSLNVSIPVQDYPIVGNAAVGRHLKQLHLGVAAGWAGFEGALQPMFVHATYEFTLSEKLGEGGMETEAISQNRSDIETQIGYAFGDKLQVYLMGMFRIPHGGLDFDYFGTYSDTLKQWHDPLMAETFIMVGGGATYQVSTSSNIGLTVLKFIAGENTINPLVAALTFSWEKGP